MAQAGRETSQAVVLRIAGRSLQLYNGSVFEASVVSRALKPVIGDIVLSGEQGERGMVHTITARRNCLTRTFGAQDKALASNIQRLYVVAAAGALFNTAVLDRVLSIAWPERIAVTLILNKIDLGNEPRVNIYRAIGLPVLELSAKYGAGFERLEEELACAEAGFYALCGVSGAGKSTILNRLIPGAGRKTAEVSSRTGQGRKTTSDSVAFVYERPGRQPLLIADLPGVQYFGVSHLSRSSVALSFPELAALKGRCLYADCQHMAEPQCAVKAALETGEMAASRYESYVAMLAELRDMPAARKYRKRQAGLRRPLQPAFKGVKDSRE